jgi:hypothetical protein
MSSWLSLMGTTLMCRTTLTKWNEEGPSPSQVASLGEEWVIRLPYLFPFWEYNVTSNCFVHPMHPLANKDWGLIPSNNHKLLWMSLLLTIFREARIW